MEQKSYHAVLTQPLAFWAASSNENNMPDAVRCIGVQLLTNESITFYITEKYADRFLANVSVNSKISLMGCSVTTFESYQYKGICEGMRDCGQEDFAIQQKYLRAFSEETEKVGLLINAEKIYFHQPSFAVTLRVEEVYEQTPHKGTGNRIS